MSEQIDILQVNHAQWLNDPITKTLLHILTKHEERIITSIAAAAMNQTLSDTYVRQLSVQLNTVKTIKKTIYDTPTFIEKSR